MARLLLIHWNEGEAKEFAKRLAGHSVRVHSDAGNGAAILGVIGDDLPEAVVISLDRLPSHGSALGTWLRQRKATRGIPLVFAGGKAEKVAAVRELLPDAVFTEWRRIRAAVREALSGPPTKPVVPATMQRYTGTRLPKKLGIKADSTVVLLGAPDGFEETLKPMPEAVTVRKQARGEGEVVVLFVRSLAELRRRFGAAARVVADGGRLWIAWPKRSSGIDTDATPAEVRRYGMDREWVDYKVAAIDETWSGLAFARRKK